MTFTQQVRAYTRQGMSNAHMIALLRDANPVSVRAIAAMERRRMGIPPALGGGTYTPSLPDDVRGALELAAHERGLPPGVFAGLLLEAIARSDLFDAIMDDKPRKRKRA